MLKLNSKKTVDENEEPKKGSKKNPATQDDFSLLSKKTNVIIEVSIKDDFCNYSYEIMKGVAKGRVHKVEGKNGGLIIKDDLRNAFANLNAHLAIIDDVFKHANVTLNDLSDVPGHELTNLYYVSGFKIKGSREDESVVLVGTKYVSQAGGRIDLVTPKIPLDEYSSYSWWKELADIIEICRTEVELYDGGKGEKIEYDEDPNPKQLSLISVGAEGLKDDGEEDDFKNFPPGGQMDDFDKVKL